MKYAIQNVNGKWWTGSCWGVEQAREEYERLLSCPLYIGGDDELDRDIYSLSEPMDVRYYDVDDPSDWPDAIATVREVKGGTR